MSQDIPSSPQLSPDGKYRWDGQRWTPVESQALIQPPPVYAVQPVAPVGAVQVQAVPLVVYRPPTNSLATMSLVFGIVSWLICPVIASVVAVACGHAARSQIKRTGEGGGGMAIAGLVLGYINLAADALLLGFFFLVLGGSLAALLAAIGAAGAIPSPTPSGP